MEFEKSRWLFSPSLMCMGYLSVGQNIAVLNNAFDYLHVDIMDGHFCRSIHLSPEYVKDISTVSKLPIEVHLMVDNPEDYIQQLIEYGANTIIVHIESAQKNIFRIIDMVHSAHRRIGIALCPSTPVENISYLLAHVDMVTVLNVDVGFWGQSLIPEMLYKIEQLKNMKSEHKYAYLIQADGGVCNTTYASLASVGVDVFVIGKTALFGKSSNLKEAVQKMLAEFKYAIEHYP